MADTPVPPEAVTRERVRELLDLHPPMRSEDVPAEWVEVACTGYSMHGLGLVHNILAAVAPLIAAAERARLAAEPDGPVAYGQGLIDGQRAERERLRELAERKKGELVLHGLLVDALPWSMLIGLLDDIQHQAGDHVA